MGVNFLLIQRVPSERRTYALQHREHRVENQASLGGYQIQKQSHTRYRLWASWDSRRRKRPAIYFTE